MDAPILAASNLAKSFRAEKALAGVTFSMRAGTVTGLIGPDGAGKTTLMRLACGLLVPDEGKIEVLGFDATRDHATVQANIGYMPQRFGLYEDLTVAENLDLYSDLHGVAKAERGERYRELLHMTGLAKFTSRLAGRLSGGMKQKLGLACTLVSSPRLLILDEPTVGVDPVSRRELWQIIDRLVKNGKSSVLISTANLDEAERCFEVVLIYQGKILEQGPPSFISRRMEGKSWLASASIHPRQLQATLESQDWVADALVQGGSVRFLTHEVKSQSELAAHSALAGAEIRTVPPRFEDGFISLLGGKAPPAKTAPAGISAPEGEVVIEVDGLRRRFGDFWAVDGISFEVRRGEIFGLLGANGAGKSTTFRMLCGLLPASGGELRVAGLNLRRAASRARQKIGYMSQKFSLYGNLSVRQNLAFFASAYGLEKERHDKRIAWALSEFELAKHSESLSQDLSLGHKQRLAMASALMHEPEILFLDEPTSGVDPLMRREFWRRINLLSRAGVTILVTTHFMEEAEYCDRLAIMAEGKILALDRPAEIKAKTRSPTMEEAFIALVEKAAA